MNLANLKVRTSLILVLLFFIFALIGGAALGILSLKQNNYALQQIMQHQRAMVMLNAAIDSYKDGQNYLGRALASYAQNIGANDYTTSSSWVEDGAGTAKSLDISTTHLLEQARAQFNGSEQRFERYKELGQEIPDLGEDFGRIVVAYDALMAEGVPPLFDHLLKGDTTGFNHHLMGVTHQLENEVTSLVMQLSIQQQDVVEGHASREEKQYGFVLKLVGVGMVAAALISALAYWFLNRMVLAPLRRIDDHFAQIAQGNLTDAISVTSTNELGIVFQGLHAMQTELRRMVLSVREGVDSIRLHATEIHAGTDDLSSRSTQQAAALQQTAASMDELASTVRQNTDNAQQASGVAEQSAKVAQEGGGAVSSVVRTMEDISAGSAKISDIVSVIDSIAFQTNILALNAAVEAARAGEQGRGFAVVAGEVRSLAQRSAQAAREINELITQSQEQVEKGVLQVGHAGKVVGEVVQAVSGVSVLMTEISEASHEQSMGIDQVNRAVIEMDAVVQQNAQLVENTALSVEALEDEARRLTQLVAAFRVSAQDAIASPQHIAPEDESTHYYAGGSTPYLLES
ncbi:methyl-accepting chemotaxis protein [Paenalcaligenes hominis]|uniref:methyl-accepting chemotaxis protein n=1 Tax=Paenalcaligenes hominis TaxID=643674 RepID=UPI0035246ABD